MSKPRNSLLALCLFPGFVIIFVPSTDGILLLQQLFPGLISVCTELHYCAVIPMGMWTQCLTMTCVLYTLSLLLKHIAPDLGSNICCAFAYMLLSFLRLSFGRIFACLNHLHGLHVVLRTFYACALTASFLLITLTHL